ncbi:serine/threonine-protein kinase [Arthrobacter sp. PsM3]|uniref:serine/threonine-protein kinase n=1 Tax=Arthrobacter sp. PsM3 TaxID=3030531 RepID=UPI00263AA451|nr:protein kinase [Arthrobacter sp. PsM3]MDN4644456.1 protein kinase [Arthrobacter sp. PsM3]
MEDYEAAGVAAPEVPGYDVGRCLGRGASATVWLVTEQSTGRQFALKSFCTGPGTGSDADDVQESIRREMRILSVLEHEHLVRALGVLRMRSGRRPGIGDGDGDGDGGQGGDGAGDGGGGGNDGGDDDGGGERGDGSSGGRLGLIMDYAAGGSLGQLVAGRGNLGPGETVTVLTPIAQALAYLHSQGFTHGDVSPGNVLFTAHGKPLLADLGVARMVADARSVSGVGTEGFRDPAPVDPVRAGLQPDRDVYSLAALGWFCLTGHAPEPGAQRPPLPLLVPGVPAALTAALEAGLQGDRRLRPSAAELAAAVHRSAAAAPVDLSVSVHHTVIPQLLTRRSLPGTARERRAELLRSLPRRFHRTRSAGPLPSALPPRAGPTTGPPAGLTAGRTGARHAARGVFRGRGKAGQGKARPKPVGPKPPGPRGYRAAAVGLAFGGVLVVVWAFAGARLPMPFSNVENLEAGHNSVPAPGTPALGAAVVPPEVQAQLASPDPEEAVRGLARLRALAFSSGDFRLLEQVNVPESSAAVADGRISAALTESGRVLAGFSTVLTEVSAAGEDGRPLAVVAVKAATSAYRERDATGTVVADAAAVPAQQLRLVLVPVEGRWRIRDILPADAGNGSGAGNGADAATGG